jgi:hypothetical protein
MSNAGMEQLYAGPRPAFGDEPGPFLLSALSDRWRELLDALAAREGLPLLDCQTHVEGRFSRTAAGFECTAVILDVELTVAPEDIKRAHRLLRVAGERGAAEARLKPVELRARVLAAPST